MKLSHKGIKEPISTIIGVLLLVHVGIKLYKGEVQLTELSQLIDAIPTVIESVMGVGAILFTPKSKTQK